VSSRLKPRNNEPWQKLISLTSQERNIKWVMKIKVAAKEILAAVRAVAAKVAKAVNQSPVRAIPAAVSPSRVRAILATPAVAAISSVF
jgi:hypothetical protein